MPKGYRKIDGKPIGFKKGHKSWLGKKRPKFSKEWVENMSKAVKERHVVADFGFKKGNKLRKGAKHTEEAKKKISEETKKYTPRGSKSHLYVHGKSHEPYTVDWNDTLKQSIRERDNYRCRICGQPQGDRAHHVHHIDYNKKNCNPDNLITLCISHHQKTNFNRKYWTQYFKQLCQK